MIDTHCHLTFPDFAGHIGEELAAAAENGVPGCITISTTTRDCLHALQIAEAYANVWCSAGVHPLYSDEGPHEWDTLHTVAQSPRCVAWGELGLDNHYKDPPRELQRQVLDKQLEHLVRWRSEGLEKPVVLHCREAFDDLIPILHNSGLNPARMVFHCFTGTPEDARKVLDFGAMISFTGVVTYRNAPEVRQAAQLVPIDRIMVETDAPFLSPEPHRGKRPCRPAWVRHVAEALAALRNERFDDFHAAVNRNTERFFGIPQSP